jgi:hypothetical protein
MVKTQIFGPKKYFRQWKSMASFVPEIMKENDKFRKYSVTL